MWKKRTSNIEKEKQFLAMGKPKIIANLLSKRNVEPANSELFFSNDYNSLSHPHKLKNVKEAVNLFCNVAKNKGIIGCAGDYDCDGILSSVMIKELCNIFKLKCNVFLPDRIEHGYGLNDKSLESYITKFKQWPDLLIVVDCGSNNEKQILEIKQQSPKTKILILDHHLIDPTKVSKSADIMINWHLQDDFTETCACGQIFHFIRGIRWVTKKVNPIEFLSYAAIGILADVSPIIGDNRIIVKNGLKPDALNHILATGLVALIKKSVYTSEVSQSDILFKVAPRINAVGRIHKPDLAFNLIMENDLNMAELMADSLTEFNEDRKKRQKEIQKSAIKHVKDNISDYPNGILVYNPEWEIGIVGIVASKLVESFNKPSLVIGRNGEVLKGSGRSLEHIDLKDILDLCKEMFVTYGGHSMAAGVTIKPEYIDKANKLFNDACEKYYTLNGRPTEIQYYDCEVLPAFITPETAQTILDSMYPYCERFNPEPIFVLQNAIITDVKQTEYSLFFSAMKKDIKTTMKFRMYTEEFGSEIEGMKADIYFTFPQFTKPDSWKNDAIVSVVDFVIKNK